MDILICRSRIDFDSYSLQNRQIYVGIFKKVYHQLTSTPHFQLEFDIVQYVQGNFSIQDFSPYGLNMMRLSMLMFLTMLFLKHKGLKQLVTETNFR